MYLNFLKDGLGRSPRRRALLLEVAHLEVVKGSSRDCLRVVLRILRRFFAKVNQYSEIRIRNL